MNWQLTEAAEYARKKGVILKGDLPIGVDRNSVDTWVYPNLFRMNTSTGAPPDYFDKNGQNWGFPTYNWEEMSKDNYAWWRARLTQVLYSEYNDLVLTVLSSLSDEKLICFYDRWQNTLQLTGLIIFWVSLGSGSFQSMPWQVWLENSDHLSL